MSNDYNDVINVTDYFRKQQNLDRHKIKDLLDTKKFERLVEEYLKKDD